MQFNWKRVLIILIFLVVVLAMFFFLYYFFFRPLFKKETNVPPTNQTATTTNRLISATDDTQRNILEERAANLMISANNLTGTVPASEKQPDNMARGGLTQVTALTGNNAKFSAINADGSIIYYNTQKQIFERVSLDGKVTTFNRQAFYNVQNVTWSHNRDRAVLEYPDGSKIIYDFNNNKQISLPKHWKEFSFSPNDQQIAFKSIATDEENRYLAVANNSGSETRTIESLGRVEDTFQVNWSPNNQMIANVIQSHELARSEVYFVGLNQENFKLMVVEGRDFKGQWSPNGDVMLYSVYDVNNNYKPQLWVSGAGVDSIGENRKKINLETWSNKCTFADNATIYCAVPKELPDGAGLFPDQVDKEVADDLYAIDLRTGNEKLIAIPSENQSITNIIVSADKEYLVYTDQNNNQIYKIKIK